MDDVAIKVEGVSKNFILPHEKVRSLKSAFTHLYKRGKKTKETQHALKNISFEIKKGEFFGIVGRNGSGKSTMLKILAGIYQPTQGTIRVEGKLVPFIELGVGFNPELTGRENVYLNGAMLGFSVKEVDHMYEDIVRFAELERFMDQKLKNYSSGMQVRLAFSMATRSEADVLLVDEVLAVGDADFQRKCFDYFKTLKKNKKTVIFVTHSMDAVREYCERAALIKDGLIDYIGDAEGAAERYLRMFNEDEAGEDETVPTMTEADKNKGRWGNKTVTVDSVVLSKNILHDEDDQLTIRVALTAHADIEDVVSGFAIRDASDEPICGSNTQIKHTKIPRLSQGQSLELTWVCPNIFADGKHVITAAVHGADGVTMYDWQPFAANMTVRKSEHTSYKITPKILVALSEKT